MARTGEELVSYIVELFEQIKQKPEVQKRLFSDDFSKNNFDAYSKKENTAIRRAIDMRKFSGDLGKLKIEVESKTKEHEELVAQIEDIEIEGSSEYSKNILNNEIRQLEESKNH